MHEPVEGATPEAPEQSDQEQLVVDVEAALMDTVAEMESQGAGSHEAAQTQVGHALDSLRKGKPKLAEMLLDQQIQLVEMSLLHPTLKDDRKKLLGQKLTRYKELLERLKPA